MTTLEAYALGYLMGFIAGVSIGIILYRWFHRRFGAERRLQQNEGERKPR